MRSSFCSANRHGRRKVSCGWRKEKTAQHQVTGITGDWVATCRTPRPGIPPGGVRSVPIGEVPPAPPNPDPGHPVQFRVLARWESAKPVRLAGGPELPELTGQFYVIRLRGLPLMPPSKTQPEEAGPNPNEGMLQAIREGSRLERKDKPGIPCAHLFKGSGDAANEVLLLFPQGADPIQLADKLVTLESRFAPFHLSVKFPLKDMMYKGELAL